MENLRDALLCEAGQQRHRAGHEQVLDRGVLVLLEVVDDGVFKNRDARSPALRDELVTGREAGEQIGLDEVLKRFGKGRSISLSSLISKYVPQLG